MIWHYLVFINFESKSLAVSAYAECDVTTVTILYRRQHLQYFLSVIIAINAQFSKHGLAPGNITATAIYAVALKISFLAQKLK